MSAVIEAKVSLSKDEEITLFITYLDSQGDTTPITVSQEESPILHFLWCFIKL